MAIDIELSRDECKKGRKFLFPKDPAEAFNVNVDYTLFLEEGVFIDSVAATAVDRRTGQDATSDVIEDTSVQQNDDAEDVIARVRVKDGLVGHSYCLTMTVALTDSFSTDVRCFEFNVKNCGS